MIVVSYCFNNAKQHVWVARKKLNAIKILQETHNASRYDK